MSQKSALQKNTSKSSRYATHKVTFFDAHHRLDRVVLAVFVLTQHMLDHDHGSDLAIRTRTAGLDCLEMMCDIILPVNNRAAVDALYVLIQHVISYVQIMKHTSLVNSKNATLLIAEIERFRDQLDTIPSELLHTLFLHDTREDQPYKEVVLSEDLTDIFRQEIPLDMYARKRHVSKTKEPSITEGIESKKNKEVSSGKKEHIYERQKVGSSMLSQEKIQVNSQEKKSIIHKDSTKILRSAVDTPKKARRKALILQELRERGEAQVGDIADAIAGVSEKTIQRDLKELIVEGSVLREGTRRWAMYRVTS